MLREWLNGGQSPCLWAAWWSHAFGSGFCFPHQFSVPPANCFLHVHAERIPCSLARSGAALAGSSMFLLALSIWGCSPERRSMGLSSCVWRRALGAGFLHCLLQLVTQEVIKEAAAIAKLTCTSVWELLGHHALYWGQYHLCAGVCAVAVWPGPALGMQCVLSLGLWCPAPSRCGSDPEL